MSKKKKKKNKEKGQKKEGRNKYREFSKVDSEEKKRIGFRSSNQGETNNDKNNN